MSNKTQSMDFDLRHLEIFSKVVELKSFSKAAEAVSLAQASVSERISNLEDMVGTNLLDRPGRVVKPTKAGEILYKHAIMLLEMKRTAALELQDFLGIKIGEIYIGGSTIPGEYILPVIIGRFRERYPLVSVILTISDTEEIKNRVLDGVLELGVVGSKVSHMNLITHEIWKDELVLAISAQHQWAKKKSVSIETLFKEPFILREAGSGTLNIIEHYLQTTGSSGTDSFHVVARFGSSTAVKEGIKAGLGVSIISSKAIDTELKTGVLKALRVTGLCMTRSFYLIKNRKKTASPICRAMFNFLQATSNEKIPHITAPQ